MLKQTEAKITQYQEGDYMVNIIETDDAFEAWLQNEMYGNSTLMFGMEKISDDFPPITKEMFLENVQAELPKYIDIYEEYGCYGHEEEFEDEDEDEDNIPMPGTLEANIKGLHMYLQNIGHINAEVIMEIAGENDPYMQKLVRKAITHTTKRILVEKETQKLRAVWPKL